MIYTSFGKSSKDSKLSMAEPIASAHGLELHRLLPKHVMPFYENLSDENRLEFEQYYKFDPLEAILSILRDPMVFAITKGEEVLSITGLHDGAMWLLFNKNLRKNRVSFFRASPVLVDYYHHFYEDIHCDVWVKNEMICQWLAKLGFKAIGVYDREGTDEQFVRFVRCKKPETNIFSMMTRPVMH